MPDGPIIPVPQPVEARPDTLRWGIVSTVKAPLPQMAGFIAFHLALGAHRVHIYLDAPDPALAERLSHPKVRFTQCDDAYWQGKPNRARSTHQMRQVFNATRTYRQTQLDWLAHIDVDEFMLTPAPLPELLSAADPHAAFVAMPPVEMMDCPQDPRHFKRAGTRDICPVVYPTFGAHVRSGFLSTTSPKIIARAGLADIRLGIHALRHDQRIVRNGTTIPGLDIGHAHAPDFDTFERHVTYRLAKGSYHDRPNHTNAKGHLIRALIDDPDPEALRLFHTELNGPTPERLDLLAAHDMLRTERLDLDAKIARFFGKLEGPRP